MCENNYTRNGTQKNIIIVRNTKKNHKKSPLGICCLSVADRYLDHKIGGIIVSVWLSKKFYITSRLPKILHRKHCITIKKFLATLCWLIAHVLIMRA